MNRGRVEAFSDGVTAIVITVIVLLIEFPKGAALITPVQFRTLMDERHSVRNFSDKEIDKGVSHICVPFLMK